MKRKVAKLAVSGAVAFILLQLVRPRISSGPAVVEVQAPPQVRQILEKGCYSCHSSGKRLSWFDEIVPGYWLVRHDILTAREHLNFSTLGSKPAAAQKAALYEAVNMIQLGAMPLPQFVALHPQARVTTEELAVLKNYLGPWTENPPGPGASTEILPYRANLPVVPAELNGLVFEPSFEDWTPISFTDRGDNNTFRMILGNEIAVKAARSGSISPWPDGTRFAKIAWQKATSDDGLIHPGNFVQVEFMVKDAGRYKETDGWGWGRWRGTGLKPYGADSHFVDECTGCHLPMRGDDFVYTLPIAPAKVDRKELLNNRAAALPQSLSLSPRDWRAITMYVDPTTRTMAALYGNDAAIHAIRSRAGSGDLKAFLSPGAQVALVTWFQREDPHWFGARIPDALKSIQLVETDPIGKLVYRCYNGPSLGEQHVTDDVAVTQTKFITNLAPAWLP